MYVKKRKICFREDGRMGKSKAEKNSSEMLFRGLLHSSNSKDISTTEHGAPRENIGFISRRFHNWSTVLNPSSTTAEEVGNSSLFRVWRDQRGVWDPEDGGDVPDPGSNQQ